VDRELLFQFGADLFLVVGGRLRAFGAAASLAEALAEAGRSALLLLYHSIWDEMRLDGDEYLNY
jgi:hypothetical protein